MRQLTLKVLEDDIEGVEIAECNNVLWSGVCKLRVTDLDWMVLRGDLSFVRQLSTRPVAWGCTIDDDSNGSIACGRFNLEACY